MARKERKRAKDTRERWSTALTILGFAFVFIPWGYASIAPDPNFFLGSGLLLIGVILLAVSLAHAQGYRGTGISITVTVALTLFCLGDYWLYYVTQGPHIHIKQMAVADPVLGPTPVINVVYENKGTSDTTVQPFYVSFFVNAPRNEVDRDALEDKFAQTTEDMFVPNAGSQYFAGRGDGGFFTTMREPLKLEEVDQLHRASHVLYYVGTIRYSVRNIPYETKFCIYLQVQSRVLFSCKQHREEHVPTRHH